MLMVDTGAGLLEKLGKVGKAAEVEQNISKVSKLESFSNKVSVFAKDIPSIEDKLANFREFLANNLRSVTNEIPSPQLVRDSMGNTYMIWAKKVEGSGGEIVKSEKVVRTSYVKSIEDLKNVENFNQGTKHNALKHIFEGEINAKTGQSMGFHYEGFPGCKGKIIGNLDQPNEFGVYRANVEIDGVAKGPKTTFFPKDYSPQEVIDAVNEGFINKEVYKNNIYRGKSKSGMEIEFVIKKGKIDSAYPLY